MLFPISQNQIFDICPHPSNTGSLFNKRTPDVLNSYGVSRHKNACWKLIKLLKNFPGRKSIVIHANTRPRHQNTGDDNEFNYKYNKKKIFIVPSQCKAKAHV